MKPADSNKQGGNFPFHPYLISAYAILALLATNIAEVKPAIALRFLMVVILGTGLLSLILKVILKDAHKSSLLLSGCLVLFYSYGHVYGYLEQSDIFNVNFGRHRILIPIWTTFFILLGGWVLRKSTISSKFTRVLNLISLVLLFFPLLRIGLFEAQKTTVTPKNPVAESSLHELSLPPDQVAPDIYYIILDAYARDDVLQEEFGIDNQPFIEQLEELGFFVARCSQSNYAQTQLSLASSLNMDYLENLGENYVAGNTSRAGIDDLISHSLVRKALENLGYRTVAFETGFKYTQIEDADLYFAPRTGTLEKLHLSGGLNDFEVMFLRTTAGLILSDGLIVLPQYLQPDFDNPRRIHRERVLYVFDQTSELPEVESPKFVFAHIVTPHPPYVFGPEGDFTDFDRDETAGYRDQVKYLNKIIIPLMEKIISESSPDPIIIIQSDHGGIGTPPIQRTKILNAYHLPGVDEDSLYPQLSPVNTFRLIFNQYFGGSFPIIKDISYFSGYKRPYNYTVITEDRSGCNGNP